MEIIDSEIRTDVMACFHALADALEAKGVLTKQELAEAAQEALLRLCADKPPEEVPGLLVLKTIAALFETGGDGTWPARL